VRVEYTYPSPEHRLYDAASRWYVEPHSGGPKPLIDAAVQCLVDGLDSTHLRMLAGASPSDRQDEIKDLLEATLDELNIPRPGELSPWKQLVADGRTLSRQPGDTIRFDVRAAHESVGGHELLVYVNDVEMTRLGAGMGMDPFAVLIPINRLIATRDPQQVPIARCECGTYGCGSTDVTIVRDGAAVHWDWLYEVPIGGGVTFDAEQYDAEVARIAADQSWERPEDTTARLVLEQIDRTHLDRYGLAVSWAAKDHANPDLFKVALITGSDDYHSAEAGYQVFLRFPRGRRSPAQVAAEVVKELQRPPGDWHATWHAIRPGVDQPPPIASRRWHHERLG
jgi:hypothetical protein